MGEKFQGETEICALLGWYDMNRFPGLRPFAPVKRITMFGSVIDDFNYGSI